MENSDQRPGAALINREWFEAAAQVLRTDELAKICLCAVQYVLYGDTDEDLCGSTAVVFAMIKPALDSDIIKYRERCARNAANARSRFERVAASGTQSQRVGANTTTTTTTTSTTTPTTTISLSPSEVEQREKWLIYGYFWATGSKAIKQEFDAFWNYYESLGWKNNKGAAIASKIACARQWRRQFETGEAPAGAFDWFNVVKACDVPDLGVWHCYAGAERLEDHVLIRLRCAPKFWESLREHLPNLERSLQGAWRTPAVAVDLIK